MDYPRIPVTVKTPGMAPVEIVFEILPSVGDRINYEDVRGTVTDIEWCHTPRLKCSLYDAPILRPIITIE